jgi:hypothetical protein
VDLPRCELRDTRVSLSRLGSVGLEAIHTDIFAYVDEDKKGRLFRLAREVSEMFNLGLPPAFDVLDVKVAYQHTELKEATKDG